MSLLLALITSLLAPALGEGEIARFTFDGGEDFTDGWESTPGAVVMDYGRNGRSLAISSYEEEQLTGKRPVGHNKASWIGPPFELPAKGGALLTVSAWGYAMFSYGQDPSYAGVLSVEWLDPDGQVIRRVPACRWIRDPSMALHERSRVPPWGIRWTYRQKSVRATAGTRSARLVFHFAKDPGGVVWVDDILVTSGTSVGDGVAAPEAASVSQHEALPLKGWLSTPVHANFFLDDEPLSFLMTLWDAQDPKAEVPLAGDEVVSFIVTDFDHLLVVSGQAAASQVSPDKIPPKGKARVIFRLPDSLRAQTGRYLLCEARLVVGGKTLARSAASFAILSPRAKTWKREEVLAGHFGQGWSGWSMEGPFEGMSPRRKGLRGLARLFGARITYRYDFGGWKAHQPQPGPFVKFEGLAPYKQNDQALKDPKQFPYRFGKEDWLAYVKAIAEQFKGHPIVYTPTGTERAATDFMYDCHRRAAKLIKSIDPDALVCLETVGLGEEGVRSAKELGVALDTDIYDMHLYSIRDFEPEDFSTLKGELAELRGGKPVKFWSTELAYTGAFTQVSKAARLWDTHMKMFAAGFDAICWFTIGAAPVRNREPVLRAWPDFIGNWSHYNLLCQYANGDIAPQLSTVAYANWVTPERSGTNRRTVHFRPILPAADAMKMDGDLSEWKDAAWVPTIHASYMMGGNHNINWRPWDEEWGGQQDASMFLASKWGKDRLYFAARIVDDKLLQEAREPEQLRYGDSIHFCYYAGGIEPGDFPRMRVYKDWVASLTDGRGALFRKTGPHGPSWQALPGAEVGFQRTKDGGVFEWSYPISEVKPLQLRPGQEFRVCACYQDFDEPLPWTDKMLDPFMSGPHGGYGTKMRYVHIGHRFIGINHDALLFAPFKMIGKK